MKDDIAISVKNVSKDFLLPHEKTTSIKSGFINFLKNGRNKKTKQHALKNVSFEVKKGEFFGIVGRNGSGKSTMLKILAEIYRPTKGKIQTNGKLVPFIELGVGFNPELTGRENVYLNGALLGFSKKEIDAKYKDIVEFAELEKFMDQKLKNYSSGMQVRLAFSLATRADSDILILDEVLAVGDEAFQRKCFEYFAKLKREKKTVILVTHKMEHIQQFCDRAMLIDKSHTSETGSPLRISNMYRQLNDTESNTVGVGDKMVAATKYVNVKASCIYKENLITINMKLAQKQDMQDPIIALGIYRDSGEQVYRWASDEKMPDGIDWSRGNDITIELEDVFPVGRFNANLYIRKLDRTIDYASFNDIVSFEVKDKTPNQSAAYWKIPERVIVNGREL